MTSASIFEISLQRLSGKDVRIIIETESSDGKTLTVPIAAVTTSADGTNQVSKVSPASTTTTVQVTTGLSAEGLVEVRPADSDALHAGDQVLVGRQ